MMPRSPRALSVLAVIILGLAATAGAQAPVVPLHTFTGPDGSQPNGGLVQGHEGALYGTTASGGAYDKGTVFRISGTTFETLHSFSGLNTDGAGPKYGSLVQDNFGNFYGTTELGGTSGYGTVFKLDMSGPVPVVVTLYSFDGTQGAHPQAGLLLTGAGDLYGTTNGGPHAGNSGTVFRIKTDGTLIQTLHVFTGPDGASPSCTLIEASDGVGTYLYGTTEGGGAGGNGTIFRIAKDGSVFATLYEFDVAGTSGMSPVSGVIEGLDGKLYGVTRAGGIASPAQGSVFSIAKDGTGFLTLHSFSTGDPGGYAPYGSLIPASDGNFYGTTAYGGRSACTGGCGGLFKMSPDGTLEELHAFGGLIDGGTPVAGLIQDGVGNLYGTTLTGVVFMLPWPVLNVEFAGTGSGTVSIAPTGLVCTGACSPSFPPLSVVSLTAAPGLSSAFAGSIGGGACDGTAVPTCTLMMDVAQSITAIFSPALETISINGAGPAFAETGASVTYSFSLTNTGSTSVTAPFSVDVAVSSGLTLNTQSSDGWACSAAPTGYTCAWNSDMPAGSTTDTHMMTFLVGPPYTLDCGIGPSPCVVVQTSLRAGASTVVTTGVMTLNPLTGMPNNFPQAADDSARVVGTSPVTIDVLANDTDPDGDVLSVLAIATPPAAGDIVINSDGTITYTPRAVLAGPDTFRYRIVDSAGASVTAVATITPEQPSLTLSKTLIDIGPVAVGRIAEGRAWVNGTAGVNLDGRIDPVTTNEIQTLLAGTGYDLTQAVSDPLAFRTTNCPSSIADPSCLVQAYYRPSTTVGRVSVARAVFTNIFWGGDPVTTSVLVVGLSADPAQVPATVPVSAKDDTAGTPLDTQVQINMLGNDSSLAGKTLYLSMEGACGNLEAHVFDFAPCAYVAGSIHPGPLQSMVYTPTPGFAGATAFSYAASEEECTGGQPGCRYEGNMYLATVTVTVGGPSTLTIAKSGSGTVTGTPGGIDCGATCSADYSAGTVVTLTATPSTGYVFAGWSGGGCTGTGSCVVTVNGPLTVTASFAVAQFSLVVTKTGTGDGTITSTPAGIDCGATCSASYNAGTVVTLNATPSAGFVFAGWSGGCTRLLPCRLTMDAAANVSAAFFPPPNLRVSLTEPAVPAHNGDLVRLRVTVVNEAAPGDPAVGPTVGSIHIGFGGPPNLTLWGPSDAEWNCSPSSLGHIGCDTRSVFPPLAPGASVVLFFSVTVPADLVAPGDSVTLAFTAGASTPYDANATDNSAGPVDLIVEGPPRPNLRVSLTEPAVPAHNGDLVRLRVTVVNEAAPGDPAVGPTVGSIHIGFGGPPNLTLWGPSDAEWNCSPSSLGHIGCDTRSVFPPLAPGASVVLFFSVTVPADLVAPGDSVTLAFTAGASTPYDANATDNSAGPVDLVVDGPARPNLRAGKAALAQTGSVMPAITVHNGDPVMFRLQAINEPAPGQTAAGPTTGTVTMTDTLPAGLSFVTAGSDPRCSAAAGAQAAGGEVVTCTEAGPIAPGQVLTFDIHVQVGATVAGVGQSVELFNIAEVSTPYDASPADDTSSPVTVTVVGPVAISLGVVKTGAGSGAVTSIPAGIDCGTTCSATYGAGAVVTLTTTPGPGSIFARWSGACTGTASCSVTLNTATSVTAEFSLRPTVADLGVTVTASPASPAMVLVGEPVTITAVVTNSGPDQAGQVRVSGFQELMGHAAGWPKFDSLSVVASQGSCAISSVPGEPITCALGALAAGASATITIDATPTDFVFVGSLAYTPRPLTVGVSAWVFSAEIDPNRVNDHSQGFFTVQPLLASQAVADLGVTVAASPASPAMVLVGEPVTITAVVTNSGPDQAGQVRVSGFQALTGHAAGWPKFESLSVVASQGSCAVSSVPGEPITCALGALAAGASATITIDATPTDFVFVGSLAYTPSPLAVGASAWVFSADTDVNRVNDHSQGFFIVQPLPASQAVADLGVTVTASPASPATVLVGQPVTITAVVTNNGPDPASRVLASGFQALTGHAAGWPTFESLSVIASQGSCAISSVPGEPITCALGALAAGASATITVSARPTDFVSASASANALRPTVVAVGSSFYVSSPETDPNRVNDHSHDFFSVWVSASTVLGQGAPTPSGADVVVHPTDPTGEPQAVTLTFSAVSVPGLTYAVPLSSAPQLASNFQLNGAMYDIVTTADFTAPVTVCFVGSFTANDWILHFESGAWVKLPNRLLLPAAGPFTTICGDAPSLSPFGVATELTNHPPTADAGVNQIVEATSPAGATVTLSGSGSDPDGDVLSFAWSGGCGTASSASATFTCPIGVSTMALTVTDGAGLSTTGVVAITVRDTTPPRATCASPDAGWHATDVVIACSASDTGAGLANAAEASFGLSTGVAAGIETATAMTGSRVVCDRSGNCVTAGPVGPIKVDKKAPVIAMAAPANGAAYILNQAVSASFSCADSGAGTSTCAGPIVSGSPLDTASIGAKTFTVTATDGAGNTSSATAAYVVRFASSGRCLVEPGHSILIPIAANGSSVFLRGLPVLARFRVCDAAGRSVSAPAVVTSFRLVQTVSNGVVKTVNQAVPSVVSSAVFQWDPLLKDWVFAIDTRGYAKLTTYSFKITLSDATFIDLRFALK